MKINKLTGYLCLILASSVHAINYAPVVKPVAATDRKLVCVALRWIDNAGADLSSVSNSCEKTEANFKRLSLGQFNFIASSYRISVPFKQTPNNVPAAVENAKKQLEAKGIKQDGNLSYAMVNNNAEKISHSGGDTSNILNTLTTTFYHEIARLNPTNLGSSGAYINGKYVFQADGTSFMSNKGYSNELTASQLYYLGWLPNTQVALYDNTLAVQEFTLIPLDTMDVKSLKAVLILNTANKPLFLSRPTLKDGSVAFALHLASGGDNEGSERVAVFGKTYTYQGLVFTLVSSSDNTVVVSITSVAK